MVISLRLKLFNFLEMLKVRQKFPTFLPIDRRLRRRYRGLNPYRLARKRGRVYGETPLTTIYQVGRLLDLSKTDHLYELGGGRGRAAFFLNHIFGCRVTVLEEVEEFVRIGREFASDLNVSFRQENFLNSAFAGPCVIYLYGTCMEDREIKKLIKNIPVGTKVASVSFPLSDYDDRFKVIEKIEGRFPWGKTDIYYQV